MSKLRYTVVNELNLREISFIDFLTSGRTFLAVNFRSVHFRKYVMGKMKRKIT